MAKGLQETAHDEKTCSRWLSDCGGGDGAGSEAPQTEARAAALLVWGLLIVDEFGFNLSATVSADGRGSGLCQDCSRLAKVKPNAGGELFGMLGC